MAGLPVSHVETWLRYQAIRHFLQTHRKDSFETPGSRRQMTLKLILERKHVIG